MCAPAPQFIERGEKVRPGRALGDQLHFLWNVLCWLASSCWALCSGAALPCSWQPQRRMAPNPLMDARAGHKICGARNSEPPLSYAPAVRAWLLHLRHACAPVHQCPARVSTAWSASLRRNLGSLVRSIVQFKEVFLTPRYLAIAMEFVAGGDMFEYVVRKGGLKESEARWFFQQLIVGVDYLHRMVRRLPGLRSTAAGPCGGSVCMLWRRGRASRALTAGQSLSLTCSPRVAARQPARRSCFMGGLAAGAERIPCGLHLGQCSSDWPRVEPLDWASLRQLQAATICCSPIPCYSARCSVCYSARCSVSSQVVLSRTLGGLSGCGCLCRAWRVEISNSRTRSWMGARGRC